MTPGNVVAGRITMLALLLVACDRSSPPTSDKPGAPAASAATTPPTTGTLQASGSSALLPLANAAKEKFEATHKGITIDLAAGGSKRGLADVISGAVQIGNSDLFAAPDQQAQLTDHRVAVVGFAAMANKGPFNEKVSALSMQDLAKVFSGTLTNWKDLGGAAQPIVVINRGPGSGTRAVFGKIVLGGDKFTEGQTEDNSGALVTKLKATKGAISYLALSFADPELLFLGLKTDGGVVQPIPSSITSGQYPIWSYEHMYTKGPPTGIAKEFLDYTLSSDFQDNVLGTVKGFIPVTQMKVSRDRD
jgi:phosphate transport system substrate-binding protein